MAKKNSKLVKRISVLGLAAALALTGMTLTGCSKALQEAQSNIDQSVTMVLNEDQSIQERYNEQFSNFTFLCADVEKGNQNEYSIDINGLATVAESNQKAYTTLNYLVDGHYFDEMDKATHENIINTLATIVQNENFKSVSIAKVNDIGKLNDSVSNCIESPLDGYNVSRNFLYGVGNLNFEDESNVVSFDTKEAVRFYKTTVQTSYGIVGYGDNGPKYGLVTTTKTDYQNFFMGHTVYLQLTPEEYQAAKENNSIIFDKFNEFVESKATDKYVIQETNVQTDKEYSANMMDEVNLEKQ